MTRRSALRDARIARGLTQTVLADRLRVAQTTISRIESGEITPTDKLAAALADALGISTDIVTSSTVPGPKREDAAPMAATAEHTMQDDYPSRAPVLAMARELGAPPAAIAAVLALRPERDPGETYWEDRIAHYAARAASLSRRLTPPSDPPPSSVPPSASSTGVRRRV